VHILASDGPPSATSEPIEVINGPTIKHKCGGGRKILKNVDKWENSDITYIFKKIIDLFYKQFLV
jgi:hypothetical protein